MCKKFGLRRIVGVECFMGIGWVCVSEVGLKLYIYVRKWKDERFVW